MTKTVGIIGAGIMAKGMAHNFLKNGYDVVIWNRTQTNAESIIEAGASWGETPAEVARQSELLIECVTDDAASRQVWTDPETGILSAARTDAVYVTTATLSLEWTAELAQLAADAGLKFLDMPITGSRAGAEGGTLSLLVGGDKEVLESVRSDLEAISAHIFYFGQSGAGMRFKLVLNTLIGIHTNAAAQAARLAEAAGIDVDMVGTALKEGGMGPSSPTTNMFFANRAMPDEQVNFAVQWIEKDLRYARDMAAQYGVQFDLLNATQEDFARAVDAGLGEQDQTKIAKIFK